MKPKYWWIKERQNPQLGTYYVAMGPLSIQKAMRSERSLYGHNYMHKFESEAAYLNRVEWLKHNGYRVQ
jgi:hypothetical protein